MRSLPSACRGARNKRGKKRRAKKTAPEGAALPLLQWIFLTHAAADDQAFAGDPARVVGCEEGDHVRDVVRLAEAAKRRRAQRPLLQVRTDDARAMRAFRHD